MKRLEDMTPAERAHYMQLAGHATASIMPEGARFLLLVLGGSREVQFVHDMRARGLPALLRETADQIERDLDAHHNN